MTNRPALHRSASWLLAIVLGIAGPAVATAAPKQDEPPVEAARTEPGLDPCVTTYAQSLARIGEAELPRIRAAISGGSDGTPAGPPLALGAADPALPGRPLFVSPSRPRSPAEISAMTAAVALARSRGASTSIVASADADRAWTASRLQEELGDYMRQKPTPFLCRGVTAYVGTLRRAASRLGPADDQRAAWIATIRASAERSLEAATRAIALSKPAPAKAALAQAELRPGTDGAREPAGPARQPAPLDNEAAILAAIDALVRQAREAGLVAEPPVPEITGATTDPARRPRAVLARLEGLKPLVSSARPLVRDQPVRLKLVAAFADFEMLDYLTKASVQIADPVASAIGQALSAVEAAHRTDCTCAD